MIRIARFGDTYESAYTFGLAKEEDSWKSVKRNATQAVSGADGLYNPYSGKRRPIAGQTVSKKFMLTSSVSWAAIRSQIDALSDATIARPMSKLWWEDVDGNGVYWTWSECIACDTHMSTKYKGRYAYPVEVAFSLDSGLWYGDTRQSWTNTIAVPASTVGRAVTGLRNDGNYDAALDVRIVPHDGLTIEDSAIGVLSVSQWQHAADIADSTQLLTQASEYKTVTMTPMANKNTTLVLSGNSLNVCGDGRFLFSANFDDGIHSYLVDPATGAFTHLDSDDQGDFALSVWCDKRFVFLANDTGGLHVYSVDALGNFTHLDSDDQGDNALGVWSDGAFVYLANGGGGLHVYSVDDSGILTHLDSDDQGDVAKSVFGDGRFVYLANSGGGLHTYSVDDNGTLTHLDSDDQGDSARDVWTDGTFVYLANDTGGLHTYAVDPDGNLSHLDSDDPGASARGVWGNDGIIYLANGTGGIFSYSVGPLGRLTRLFFVDPGGTSEGVYSDGTLVYLANNSTIRNLDPYTETGNYSDLSPGDGTLLDSQSISQMSWLWLPPGRHQTNVVVDCDGGGVAKEVDVYVEWWNTYIF